MRVNNSLQIELQSLQKELDGDLRIDSLTRRLYATDASIYQQIPLAVAIPKTKVDLQRLIQFANNSKIGLIPRAAGTSLAGQVVGDGIVVDISRHFTEIIEIDPENRWVRVQPGVIRNELNMALHQHRLHFAPETSTQNRAMIGGMVGNNSCGANSIVYGSTRDHLLEVKGYLSDGSEATFGDLTNAEFAEKCDPAADSLESHIYRDMRNWLQDPEIRKEISCEFPKPDIHRRNAGYAVDLLMNSSPFATENSPTDEPFNFCKLIAGSEGTLFFATEIKLRCVPLPPPVSGLICPHFASVVDALHATVIAMRHDVFACELIDRFILEGASRNLEQNENIAFVDGTPEAILAIEFRGQTQQSVLACCRKLASELRAAGLGYEYPVLMENDTRRFWDVRKAGLGVVNNMPGDEKPVTVIEDTAVSVQDLPKYIEEIDQLLKTNFGLDCVHYAHAGAGEIHLRPILNLKTELGRQQLRAIAEEIAKIAKKFGGTLSGEHGDGRARSELLARMIGDKNLALLRQIKNLWDPNHVFNPGKIVDAPKMDEDLRYDAGLIPIEVPTVFDFGKTKGVVRAAELCNGSGDCRKTELTGGTMCPSYMATRDERDTTRARANTLRQILSDPTDKQRPFNSDELKEVMDLCLSCKGCLRECPSNVDMARLKAEFLQGYYDANGVPWRARFLAGISNAMRLATPAPWLFNFLIGNSATSSILKQISGVAPQRSLPKMSRTTLRRWYKSHDPHANVGKNGSVILFCDEFTNYLDASVGMATVELLEALGYGVELATHNESGRAAISKGLLRKAQAIAVSNVKSLGDSVSDDKPLIGIEPSAILGFRDEYPDLVGTKLRSKAETLATNTLTIDEFIDREFCAGNISDDSFTKDVANIRLHGHCHQKALSTMASTIRILQLPPNYQVRMIPSGCCGMAGTFGYEREHYKISMQIGELVLFPIIRKEPTNSIIAAPGISCRQQIAHGAGRQALHPIQILRQAMLDPMTSFTMHSS